MDDGGRLDSTIIPQQARVRHLVSAFTSVRKQEGKLKLLNLTNKVHGLLQITKRYSVFDIMDYEEIAVRSFGQSAAATG